MHGVGKKIPSTSCVEIDLPVSHEEHPPSGYCKFYLPFELMALSSIFAASAQAASMTATTKGLLDPFTIPPQTSAIAEELIKYILIVGIPITAEAIRRLKKKIKKLSEEVAADGERLKSLEDENLKLNNQLDITNSTIRRLEFHLVNLKAKVADSQIKMRKLACEIANCKKQIKYSLSINFRLISSVVGSLPKKPKEDESKILDKVIESIGKSDTSLFAGLTYALKSLALNFLPENSSSQKNNDSKEYMNKASRISRVKNNKCLKKLVDICYKTFYESDAVAEEGGKLLDEFGKYAMQVLPDCLDSDFPERE